MDDKKRDEWVEALSHCVKTPQEWLQTFDDDEAREAATGALAQDLLLRAEMAVLRGRTTCSLRVNVDDRLYVFHDAVGLVVGALKRAGWEVRVEFGMNPGDERLIITYPKRGE